MIEVVAQDVKIKSIKLWILKINKRLICKKIKQNNLNQYYKK